MTPLLPAILIATALALGQTGQGDDEGVLTAWWVGLRLEPATRSQAAALSVPAKLRGARLSYSNDPEVLAQLPAEAAESLRENNAMFRHRADLDGNKVPEDYRPGFYRTRSGEGGIFLAVFEQGRQVAFEHFATSTGNGTFSDFSVLLRWRGQLYWKGCLECDDYGRIRFDGRRLRIEDEGDLAALLPPQSAAIWPLRAEL